jgi:hypothetical protein
MKQQLLFIIILFHLTSFGQTAQPTKKDLKDCKEIIFYGYDFSHFKLAEAKRMEKDISKYIPAWIRILNKFHDEKYLAKKLQKDKVIFDFEYTGGLIKKLDKNSLVSISKHIIPSDSVQSIINSYQLTQQDGIGFVVIVECFDKAAEKSTAYFTFFDIASKKIIMSSYFGIGHAIGFGLSEHWGTSLENTFYYYLDEGYKKELKAK